MSLARAFTKRREKRNADAVPPTPTRASVRDSVKMGARKQISAPVALLSTTNMLSYNAPDIAVYRQQKEVSDRKVSSSSSSTHSNSTGRDDSDSSSVSSQTKDSFLTDNSSVDDNSPTELSPSPEENHLSRYFPNIKSIRRSVSTSDMGSRLSSSESPAIPQRAPSHSKRAHEASLARKRSLLTWERERESVNSTVLSSAPSATHVRSSSALSHRSSTNMRSSQPPRSTTPTSLNSTTSYNATTSTTRTSLDIFRSNLITNSVIEPNHPFGKELEKLNEVAEEFVDTVRDAEWETDATHMKQLGLIRWCANDYAKEIEPLFVQVGFWQPALSGDGGFF